MKKEQIKDRMLKTAARLWGLSESDIETHFDPLILLLLEACAGELEQIGYAINTTQSRLIDRLAELILPEAVIHAQPASCILQATPAEPLVTIPDTLRFYTTQRLQQAGTAAYNRDFHFTPAGQFKLFKASLDYMKAGSKVYRLQGNGQKELLHDEGGNGHVSDIWLALSADKRLDSLKGLQLFFDLKGHSDATAFYSSLHRAKAYAGDTELLLYPGYYNGDQFALNLEEALSTGHDYSRKVNRRVAGVYRDRFLHLAGDLTPEPGPVPEAWMQLPEKIRQGLEEGYIFIRIVPGRLFPQETMDRLLCSTNAFPAVNRSLATINYRTDNWVNIIPLQVEGSFLDLHSITGSSGQPYRINMAAGSRQVDEGEAIVRSSGTGKTGSREVREIIGSLMEAIRDESAYFSRMSNEFVLARLREITRILARLEDQMQIAKDKKETLHYVLLRPAAAGDSVTVNYWTTYGDEAHAVKAGTALTAFNHALTSARSTYTLTNVTGGKSVVSELEKKYMLQRQLLSGGKIVSAEDVKLLSYQLFGDRLDNVEVKKGIHPGNGSNQGFRRTIDIFLTLAPQQSGTTQDEIRYLCSELEYHLDLCSSPVYPFRVVVQ